MSDKEIMEIYHGWPADQLEAIQRYVNKFHMPWPTFGPKEVEFIDYCVEVGTPVDYLPADDPMVKKYYPEDRLY